MDRERLMKAIDARRSRRKYINTPMDSGVVKTLEELVKKYNAMGNVRMELVTNDGTAFNGLSKSYGLLSGVNDFIGLIADKKDFLMEEKLGYYGEILVLEATALGLGTCWVGGSFDKKNMPFALSDNENVACTITIGSVDEKDSFKEKLVRSLSHRKTKTVEELYTGDPIVPEWFINGMQAVQKAPSAVNRQPVLFSYDAGVVTASVKDETDFMMAIDLGIAKLHFELGAGSGSWEWGNGSRFVLG